MHERWGSSSLFSETEEDAYNHTKYQVFSPSLTDFKSNWGRVCVETTKLPY